LTHSVENSVDSYKCVFVGQHVAVNTIGCAPVDGWHCNGSYNVSANDWHWYIKCMCWSNSWQR